MIFNPRLTLTGGAVIVLTGLNTFLLYDEEILTFDEESGHIVRDEDPLLGLRYNAGQRRSNLKSFGLDDALIEQVLQAIARLEKASLDKTLVARFSEAGDPQALADSLCGDISDRRPRYAAMEFLVEEVGGQRQVIDLRKTISLTRQDWAIDGPIDGVYREVELAADRESDATLMGVAALLLSREEDVYERRSPWGPGLLQDWDWTEVVELYPEVQTLVVDYFALMQLAAEKAREEEGICD